MNNNIGKIVYPAEFILEDDCYLIHFPDFGVTGKGFKDLNETIEFASNMLGEMIIDYKAKGKELPKHSVLSESGGECEFTKNIEVDADVYALKAKNNRERLLLAQEHLKDAEPSNNKKSFILFGKEIELKKIIIIAIIASVAIALLMVLSDISYNHTEEKRQKRIEEEEAAADEYIQQARDDLKQELYKKAQEDLGEIYDLDLIEYEYRRSERNSLYHYAELLSMRSNGAIVDDLYELIDDIEFAKDDEFYDDYQSVKAEIISQYNSAEVKGKLQHYFLTIDDSLPIDELQDVAESSGFYTETLDLMDGLDYLYISEEPKTGYGSGAEINYTYDVDHIQVTFYSDKADHKQYYFRDKYASVYCYIDNSNAVFENWMNEYREKFVEPRVSKEFKDVKEAMKFANDYEYKESE